MANYITTQKPLMTIIGIECRTSNRVEAGPIDIPQLWDRFYNEKIMEKIPNRNSKDIIALYCDYDGDHTEPYSLVIGCSTSSMDEIPKGMVAKIIPTSRFAVFKANGEYPQSLINTWINIWQTDLNRTYTADYEIYNEEFILRKSKEVDVYIAIN